MFEITLEDLRQLGRKGHATVRLMDGSEYTLRRFEARSTVQSKAIIASEIHMVTKEKSFREILPQIRTIKFKGEVAARREKDGRLLSTGRGYHRNVRTKHKNYH